MSIHKNSTQLAIVGGGPGGYPAAFLAADLGLQVALIDLEARPGGVCLFRGCIPSKALLHVAKLINEARDAAGCGIKYPDPEINLDELRAWKNKVVGQLTGGTGQLASPTCVVTSAGRGFSPERSRAGGIGTSGRV